MLFSYYDKVNSRGGVLTTANLHVGLHPHVKKKQISTKLEINQ